MGNGASACYEWYFSLHYHFWRTAAIMKRLEETEVFCLPVLVAKLISSVEMSFDKLVAVL